MAAEVVAGDDPLAAEEILGNRPVMDTDEHLLFIVFSSPLSRRHPYLSIIVAKYEMYFGAPANAVQNQMPLTA